MEERLPTHLYVQSHLWRCSAEGIPVYVVRRGERESGMILLKVAQPGGSKVYSQSRDMEGRLGWLAGLGGDLVPEADANAYIERQVMRDPDIWVIEVESRDGSHPFDGPMI
ncbi:DUF1491 family protein [Indioceanicola profundi]|uniref:DUF1491 family protein n=1 Tax=Indioceanicola profundi TaxID=2220096 RepID=UPI000E6AC872|nr:DUF1491 family protein [Indioceanicola profundi]